MSEREFYSAKWGCILENYSISDPVVDVGDINREVLIERCISKFQPRVDSLEAVNIGAGNWLYLERLGRVLRQKCVKMSIVGIDLVRAPMEFGIQKAYHHLHQLDGEIKTVEGDAIEVLQTCESQTVDMVLCLETLEHVADEGLIREVRRILKDRGLMICSVPNRTFPRLSLNWSAGAGG